MKFSKKQKERALSEKFLEYYNSYHKSIIKFIRHGEQGQINEPDIVCSEGIFIEITSSSYGEKIQEAEQFIVKNPSKRSGALFRHEFEIWENHTLLIGPDKKAFQCLRERIADKMNKKYTFTEDSKKFILLVSVNTPITTQDDHKKSILESPITLKQESIIDEIWYMQSRIYGSNNPVTTKEIIEIGDGDWSIFCISRK